MFKKSLLTLAFTGVATLSTYATAADTLQIPAYTAAVTQLVPKEQLARANGMVASATGVGTLLSPLIAAALLSFVGLKGVILVDLATFLLALGCLLAVRIPDLPLQQAHQPEKASEHMLEGGP